jgi:signal peptidase I
MKTSQAPLRTTRVILFAFAAALSCKVFLFDLMVAEGRSMLPTIVPGKVVLVNRVAYGLRNPFSQGYLFRWGRPRAGDIVVFSAPDGLFAIKRFHEADREGLFLALGDNREESLDSRQYGPLRTDAILGKVMGIK